MRRITQVLLATLILLSPLGCQLPAQGGSAAEPGTLASILSRGVLRAGLSGDQPPLNMTTKDGQVIGLEVDLMLALAESMGVEVEFVPMPFAALLPALEAGQVDLVISGMAMTAERNARVAFAGPYFVSGKSVLTKLESLARVETPAQLDDPARTYAALAGSTSEIFVRNLMPNAKLVTAPNYEAAVGMVVSGEVDAMVGDYPVCAHEVRMRPDAGLVALATPFTVEPLGIALPAGDPLFVNLVQNYLTTLRETGLLIRYKVKWFADADYLTELR